MSDDAFHVNISGEIFVENGVVKAITRRTGHYRADPRHINQFLHRLRRAGIDVSTINVSGGY